MSREMPSRSSVFLIICSALNMSPVTTEAAATASSFPTIAGT